MHALTANITHNEELQTRIKTCLKTTNMEDTHDRQTGRERDLSDK